MSIIWLQLYFWLNLLGDINVESELLVQLRNQGNEVVHNDRNEKQGASPPRDAIKGVEDYRKKGCMQDK